MQISCMSYIMMYINGKTGKPLNTAYHQARNNITLSLVFYIFLLVNQAQAKQINSGWQYFTTYCTAIASSLYVHIASDNRWHSIKIGPARNQSARDKGNIRLGCPSEI